MSELKKSSTSWKFRTAKTVIHRTQIENSPIEKLSTTEMFSIPTLIDEIKPVVLVKFEFERIEIKRFFLELSDYRGY